MLGSREIQQILEKRTGYALPPGGRRGMHGLELHMPSVETTQRGHRQQAAVSPGREEANRGLKQRLDIQRIDVPMLCKGMGEPQVGLQQSADIGAGGVIRGDL